VAGVFLATGGEAFEVVAEAFAIEAADEDFRVGHGAVGPLGSGMACSAKATESRSRSGSMPVASTKR